MCMHVLLSYCHVGHFFVFDPTADAESLLQVAANPRFMPTTTTGVINLGFTGFKHIPYQLGLSPFSL